MTKVFKIEMAETQSGKPYKKAFLDEKVFGNDRFNIFTFHTRYEDVVVGRDFAIEEFEKDGKYIKLSDPDKGVKTSYSRKSFDASAAVALKQESITKSQDRKDESIKISSTMRDAVLIVTSRNSIKDATDQHIENEILRWREFLLNNWDLENQTQPPF